MSFCLSFLRQTIGKRGHVVRFLLFLRKEFFCFHIGKEKSMFYISVFGFSCRNIVGQGDSLACRCLHINFAGKKINTSLHASKISSCSVQLLIPVFVNKKKKLLRFCYRDVDRFKRKQMFNFLIA